MTDDELFALMPEGADREDLLGAMITAQFFLEQYGPMFHTGDTRIWEALSTPECGYCSDGIGNAKKVTDDGWVVSGADVTVDPTQTQASMTSDTEAAVAMHGTIAEGRMAREGDEDRATGAPGPVVFAFRLVYGPDHWLVSVVATQDEAA